MLSVLGSYEDIDLDGVDPKEADVVDTVEGETNNVEGEEVKVEADDTETKLTNSANVEKSPFSPKVFPDLWVEGDGPGQEVHPTHDGAEKFC